MKISSLIRPSCSAHRRHGHHSTDLKQVCIYAKICFRQENLSDYSSVVKIYDDITERQKTQTGLGHSFTQELVLVSGLVHDLDQLDEESELTQENINLWIASILSNIQSPIIIRRLVDLLRQEQVTTENITTTAISDSTLSSILAPYKGNTLFVDFWNLGCGPCHVSMLAQRSDVEELKNEPVKFIYISNDTGERRASAEKWLKENKIHGEQLFVSKDDWNRLSTYLNFASIPFSIIVNNDGQRILFKNNEPDFKDYYLNHLK